MNTHPTLTVILKGPTVGGCTSELKGTIAVTAPGVQNYTLALNTLTQQTACGYASAAAALAAGVTEIHVQVLGANVQYVTGGPVDYANGLNVGPITFGSGGSGGGAAVVFASNYSQVDGSNWKSTELGDAGTYIDNSVPTQYWWNGVAPGDATPSFYFGYGISVNAKPWGFGAFVKAPANGTANVTGKTNLKLAVWGNDELMNTHPTLTLILKGPAVGGCTSELKGSIAVAAPGVQNYTVPLNTFTLQTACGYASAAAALAAGVTEVHIQVLGTNVQYVTGGPVDYANGLNVGPISFN
jgi:phenylpyruvate tautomerase PptA (4-oxalocrotonate tautomerase family)